MIDPSSESASASRSNGLRLETNQPIPIAPAGLSVPEASLPTRTAPVTTLPSAENRPQGTISALASPLDTTPNAASKPRIRRAWALGAIGLAALVAGVYATSRRTSSKGADVGAASSSAAAAALEKLPPAAPVLTLFAPSGVTAAPDGRVLIADRGNHRVLVFHNGVLETLAGSGSVGFADGSAATARFNEPRTTSIAPDGAVLVADEGNHRIRVIRGEKVETLAGAGTPGFADGPALSAQFNAPAGIALGPHGGAIIADSRNHRIRLIQNGKVTTIAGSGQRGFLDGPALFAKLDSPVSVAVAPDGAVYIADAGNLKIRMLRGGWVTTVLPLADRAVGMNEAMMAELDWQPALTVGSDGAVYFSDGSRRRVLVARDGKASVLAGSGEVGSVDGEALYASFSLPEGIAVGPDGSVYVADAQADRIRVIRDGQVKTLYQGRTGGFIDGKAAEARFNHPWALTIGSDKGLYVADWKNNRIRVIQGGDVRTFAGSGQAGFRDGLTRDADFNGLWDIKAGQAGALYVADGENHRIRIVENGQVLALAGSGEAGHLDGEASRAKFNAPGGIAVGKDGTVYVADTMNARIRAIKNGQVRTIAGSGVPGFLNGPAAEAQLDRPGALDVDDQGWVYVADVGNNQIRILRHGTLQTFAGSGQRGFADGEQNAAQFNAPLSVGLGPRGEIYVADSGNHRIRVIENGRVSTLAGAGVDGYADRAAAEAWFARPTDAVPGPDGLVYVVDSGNHLIRVIDRGQVSTIAGH